jgi:hypothetical protein
LSLIFYTIHKWFIKYKVHLISIIFRSFTNIEIMYLNLFTRQIEKKPKKQPCQRKDKGKFKKPLASIITRMEVSLIFLFKLCNNCTYILFNEIEFHFPFHLTWLNFFPFNTFLFQKSLFNPAPSHPLWKSCKIESIQYWT